MQVACSWALAAGSASAAVVLRLDVAEQAALREPPLDATPLTLQPGEGPCELTGAMRACCCCVRVARC
jgi:hypothetical protein